MDEKVEQAKRPRRACTVGPENMVKARNWLEKDHESGCKDCAQLLGPMRLAGAGGTKNCRWVLSTLPCKYGIPKDRTQALHWLQKSLRFEQCWRQILVQRDIRE